MCHSDYLSISSKENGLKRNAESISQGNKMTKIKNGRKKRTKRKVTYLRSQYVIFQIRKYLQTYIYSSVKQNHRQIA